LRACGDFWEIGRRIDFRRSFDRLPFTPPLVVGFGPSTRFSRFFLNGIGGVRNPTYYSLNCKVVTKLNLGIPRGERYMRGLERSKERN